MPRSCLPVRDRAVINPIFSPQFLQMRKKFGYFRCAADGAKHSYQYRIYFSEKREVCYLKIDGASQKVLKYPFVTENALTFVFTKVRTELVREVKFERINAKS